MKRPKKQYQKPSVTIYPAGSPECERLKALLGTGEAGSAPEKTPRSGGVSGSG